MGQPIGVARQALMAVRRTLRDVPAARSVVVRTRLLIRRPVASDGVLFVFYHAIRARDRRSFASQLRRMRQFGDPVSLNDALDILKTARTGGRYLCLTIDDGEQSAFRHGLPLLAEGGVPACFFVVPGWIDDGRPSVVTWDDCRAMARAGFEIGSHSLTHSRLSLLRQEEVAYEMRHSRARIEAELGQTCAHCACPWGQPVTDYRPDREPSLARAAGYHSFLTTIPKRAPPGADRWALPRVRMEPGWGDAELRYALLR